ncbi:DUF4253 domain-containing protein [Actinoplanes sp. TBRC 11911]|uniref:DUF4253 domain-containing protein n=1 Tax=Actinoplanes sp. TBRC 11911 TaxID=2729386 RepID=UPI001B7D5381|nr:DUF4253 domain-containing protein [Actinoplanes sp. TBRC 11911]
MSNDLPGLLARLTVALPPGRLVRGDHGDDEEPALWVSDEPATPDVWRTLQAEHPGSGLYPLLLDTLWNDTHRPWDEGELWPATMSAPGDHDPDVVLRQWWASYARRTEAATTPFTRRWPGLAAPGDVSTDPDRLAARCAGELLRINPKQRIGLVAAARGSDALAACGWQGPGNHENDTGVIAAVVRSWEDRFGVRVIGLGYADLDVSVAAAPSRHADAMRIAAEHFAFCPDNVLQGSGRLIRYAHDLVDAEIWHFWWD